MSSDFNDLLFEAEKLSNEIEGTTDLPKVERSLRQVLEASNELYTRVTQTGAQDIQANLLLGSKGIDLPQIAQKLESISCKRSFEPLDPTAENDVNTFLKNEIENCILSCIDDVHKETLGAVEEQISKHIRAEWTQEKRKILNAMIGPSHNFLDMRKNDMFLQTHERVRGIALTHHEDVYARQIIDYNKMVVKGSPRPILVTMLSKAAEQFNDNKVNEMWEMVKYMIELPPFPRSEDAIVCRNSPNVQRVLVSQARRYLEERYKMYMSSVVNENMQLAKRGGIPGTYPLVRSFVGIRLGEGYLGLQDKCIEDRPLWPMVYYCLRSGDLTAALHCLKKAGTPFEDLSAVIEEHLRTSEDKHIMKLEAAIKFQYRRHVRNATDPFKRAVYCVLGCCDVNDEHSEVAKTADDYLWLKLSLVRDDLETEEHIMYSDLQTTVLEEYGEAHYEAHLQPHLYFQVLMLTGQFEAAVEFLARTERYRVHAVHFAITINELFMLGGPRCVDAPLIAVDVDDPPPSRRLNIARLIMLYVKKFELTNPFEALQYYYMLRHMCTTKKQNLFKVCVVDLAQETREYDVLFGVRQPSGLRSPGLVDQFSGAQNTTEALAEMVAKELVKKGLYEDAIKLYGLADNQEEVFSLMCTLLSQVVYLPRKPGSLRDRLQLQSQEITTRFATTGYKCSAPVVSTFAILTDLLMFFDFYHNNQHVKAMEVMRHLRLIPLARDEIDERVSNFKRLAPTICKVIPDILLAMMNILYEQYKTEKSKSHKLLSDNYDDKSSKQLTFLRDKAKCLTNFAGTIPYRMPGDTNTRLVQIEILMH